MLTIPKSDLYRLIDALPESETLTAKRLLEFLLSKTGAPLLLALLDAPDDDEPLSQEDIRELDEAQADIAAGRVVPWEEIKREYNL